MTGMVKRIKLRATITIDIDATDYLDAARIQKEIEDIRDEFRDRYGPAEYDLRERRDRGSNTPEPEPEVAAPKQKRAPRPRKPKATAEQDDLEIGGAG